MTDIDVEIEMRVRERTALLEAANRELEVFVAAVASDLRTPLREIQEVIRIFTEQHAAGSPVGATECIGCILLNTAQMSRMLDGLSRIARGGSGDRVLQESAGATDYGANRDVARENRLQRRGS